MPFLQTIHAYTSAGRIWPIFTETDSAGRPQTHWIQRNAPDPPTDTLLPTYDLIITWISGDPLSDVYGTICGVTLGDKLFYSDLDQPPDAAEERQIPTPRIVTGLTPDPVDFPDFACTIQRLWEPFTLRDNFIGFITSERPSMRLEFATTGLVKGLNVRVRVPAPAPFDFVEFGRPVRTPNLQPHLTPSTTQPRRIQPLPSPRPTRLETFDPNTGERVDPETGEPIDRSPCTEEFIRVPVFEDIIHLTPRPKIPWLQVPDVRTGKLRWTLSRNLTALEAEEFIRRREIAEQIRQSPQPEFARTVAEVLTTIDDIQDALLTVIVFARLAIRRLPGPLRTVLAGGLAVADTMQLMGFGALDLVRVRAIKGRLMKEGSALPFTKKWKAQALRRLARRMPTYGELVQVLQTTDQLFGIGVSLGPILGFIMDILFGLGKGARIGYRDPCLDIVRGTAIKLLEKWGKIPLGTVPPRRPPTGFLAPYKSVLDPSIQDLSYREILDSILVRTNPRLPTSPFTQAEFTQQLAAYNVFLDMVEETTRGENIDELTAQALDGIVKPAPEIGPSATILGELGLEDPTTSGRLPFPGEPTQLTAADAANQTMKTANQMLLNHYNLDPGSIPAFYMGYLAEEIGVKALRILDPKHQEPKWIPRDAWRTMDALYNRGFLPPPGASISQIQGALSALLMASDPTTAEAPSFSTMAEIVLQLGWTGP